MKPLSARLWGMVWAMCLLWTLAIPSGGYAAPVLEAPGEVVRGAAFAAGAESAEPVTHFVFFWLGKRYLAEARQEDGLWRARLLLPVPLDGKAPSLELSLAALAAGAAGILRFGDRRSFCKDVYKATDKRRSHAERNAGTSR